MTPIHEAVLRKIRELPPLPLAAQKLLEVVEDDTSSANDLTRILKTDSALTAKVLHLVNSAFYGFPGKITTLSRAVVILGFSAIKNIAISFATSDALRTLKGPMDWEGYWLHCVTAASCGQAVAEKAEYPIPEEAFIACLLHDVGYAVISAAAPQMNDTLWRNRVLGNSALEQEELGLTHAVAGQLVMEHWRIPQMLCRVIRHHHNPRMIDSPDADPLLRVVIFADLYACLQGAGYYDTMEPYRYDTLLQKIGVLTDDFGALFDAIAHRIDATRKLFSLPPEVSVQTGKKVAFVSADRARAHWIDILLDSWGYDVVHESILHTLAGGPESRELSVLLDCGSLQQGPMFQLAECLQEKGVRVTLVAAAGVTPVRTDGLPVLPYIFSRMDLNQTI